MVGRNDHDRRRDRGKKQPGDGRDGGGQDFGWDERPRAGLGSAAQGPDQKEDEKKKRNRQLGEGKGENGPPAVGPAADREAANPAAEAEADGFAGRRRGCEENEGDDHSPGQGAGFAEDPPGEHVEKLRLEKIKQPEGGRQHRGQSPDGHPRADPGVEEEKGRRRIHDVPAAIARRFFRLRLMASFSRPRSLGPRRQEW